MPLHKHHGEPAEGVSVYNRLDKVVLEIDGRQTPMTPNDARALGEQLFEAADVGEKTPNDGAEYRKAGEKPQF